MLSQATALAAPPVTERPVRVSTRVEREGRPMSRPRVEGPFLHADGAKLYVQGVTYGPFRPDEQGCEYGAPEQVDQDFAAMAEAGINAVRTYTVPPRWLLDLAARHGLRVMVGLPWEQHITFLDGAAQRRGIEQRVRQGVRAVAGHPAILAFAVGNEIPAPIVRWYGRERIERFLYRLYRIARAEDPEALVTYVNYPTTEYLQLGFLDFLCFNVYLEDRATLGSYLARLANLADGRPLVMGEVGLDSQRNGEQEQARTLSWQIAESFACGCAGLFVFAWTDQWHRGGFDIDDWDFGLTRRDRSAKPALAAVSQGFDAVPFAEDEHWPMISVIVCSYNGAATLGQTLAHLERLDYPCYEVVVVIDGSADASRTIARQHEVRLIEVDNGGLSRARNIGMRAAQGEILAYIDDDAFADPQWLKYLAWTYRTQEVVAVGGPNLVPADDPPTAQCVAHSPGGPNHVLLSDRVAEHIPGCNMSIRKSALEAIGGFDEQFRIAGDDVDVCWRLQERGGVIGFHPAALVWHHRRDSVRNYLRQQHNYGRAEVMLERKWPRKYNWLGHVCWGGRVYGDGLMQPLLGRRWRVYHGVWGANPFQSIYPSQTGLLQSIPLMPEWYLLVALVLLLAVPGLIWQPLLFAAPLLVLAVGPPLVQAMRSARAARLPCDLSRRRCLKQRLLIGCLHVLQPIARLRGRLSDGLTPWRRPRLRRALAWPWRRSHMIWSEQWQSPEQRLERMEAALHRVGAKPIRGGVSDRWDLEVRAGLTASVRTAMVIEEHGAGRQLIRLRCRPVLSRLALGAIGLGAAMGAVAFAMASTVAVVMLTILVVLLAARMATDAGVAMAAYLDAVESEIAGEGEGEAEAEGGAEGGGGNGDG